MLKRLLLVILVGFSSTLSHANSSEDIYEGMSESEHFRVFPYVDKAYKYEGESDYLAALEELKKARRLAPEHPQFMRYAYELGVKAGVHDAELEKFVSKLPEKERSNLILGLRTVRSEQAEFFTIYEFRSLANGMTVADTKEWFVRHVYAIEKKRGAKAALKWSSSQSTRYKTVRVYRFEAYEWFKEKQFAKVIPLINKIEREGQLSTKDTEYLVMSFISLGNVLEAEKIVEGTNSLELEVRYLRAYSEILINKNHLAEARIQLVRLGTLTTLTSEEKKQLTYISSLNEEQLRLVRAQGAVFSQCLQSVISDYHQGNITSSRALFDKCDPLTSPVAWLNVAEQIDAYDAIASYQFNRSDLDKKRRGILTSYYIKESDWLSLVELHENSLVLSEQEVLANAYSELEQFKLSTEVWLGLYQQTKEVHYLDLAAYNSSLGGDYVTEANVYHQLIAEHSSSILSDKALFRRAISLMYKDVGLFLFSDVEFLANASFDDLKIEPNIWFEQGQCAVLKGNGEGKKTSPYLMKAISFCISESEPLGAVKKYSSSTESPNINDYLIMARWSYEGRDFLNAAKYWSLAGENNLSTYEQFCYVDSLRESSKLHKADDKWSEFLVSSEPEWWRLGISISDDLEAQDIKRFRTIEALNQTHSPLFVKALANEYIDDEDIQELTKLSLYVLEVDNQGDMSAELGYLMSGVLPHQSEQLLKNANRWSPYDVDTALIAQLAFVSDKNGNKAQSEDIYRQTIDNVDMENDVLDFMQTSHRDLLYGWKFSVAGWIGESNGAAVPGYSSRTGDFFLYEDAKYYFDQPVVPGLSVSIAGLHSGQYDSEVDSWSSSEVDLGVLVQPLKDWNYFLKVGVKQGLNSTNDNTKPYIRLSADVFSNDNWTSAWKRELDSWLYQKLFLDGLYYIDEGDDYSLYARYDIGRVFKVYDEHRQRLISYGFSQWSNSQSNDLNYDDIRLGAGVTWAWEWSKDKYDGLSVYSEVGIEWQHIIENTNYNGSADSFILRFASYF
ncbi:hypothetical protein BCU71_13130 [Vibrio lentus]|uniref:NfrA family protein n=1 Tax=Vibrio lentus TaxID=136468 RepID=UPI000CAE98FC|nr:hypothetical protein [Vibrio lentus]PMH31057.1 hypothetical protein BCU71_13130 [Vibrio lentus]PMK62652.1 hypothetical protein BCT93_13290 [Vibrio lentus]